MGKQDPKSDLRERHIPFMDGRPEREMPIGREDFVNLRIALALFGDVEAFCKDKHLFELHR
jgi:hypothetical protein